MRERPILFSGAMVRAILNGRKNQTRRVVRPDGDPTDSALRCPYGAPGDRLWVRETWAVGRVFDRTRPAEIPTVERDVPVWWRADGFAEESDNRGRWRPSIHMPRWASRITLDIVSVRVERLQAITEADAFAEGVEANPYVMCDGTTDEAMSISARDNFRALWDSINGKRLGCSWGANPWVWVVEFRGTT